MDTLFHPVPLLHTSSTNQSSTKNSNKLLKKLGFDKLELKAEVSEAADTVMTDRGHLDPNPIPVSKEDVMKCLEDIKVGNL